MARRGWNWCEEQMLAGSRWLIEMRRASDAGIGRRFAF
jgi:hypothetical protein